MRQYDTKASNSAANEPAAPSSASEQTPLRTVGSADSSTPLRGAIEPPAIAAPKGGGGLRPIAETLEVAGFTGKASFSIPIAATSPPSGFGPNLALTYSSGTGNGLFGLGWGLPLPSIARRTDKGVPIYAGRDAFMLRGSEELVRCADAGGILATRPSVPDGDVTPYRARFDTGERIERVQGSQHDYWKVVTPGNVTHWFGRSTPTSGPNTISVPNRPERIFEWLLERSEDELGNVITYEYRREDGSGSDGPAEAQRGADSYQALYPKRIRYGNTVPGDETSCVFELVFDYVGDGDPWTVDGNESWDAPVAIRPDVFSSGRGGFDLRTYRLCHRVIMFSGIVESGPGLTLVSATAFDYGAPRPRGSRLLSVEHTGYARDDAQSPYSSVSAPKVTLAYTDAEVASSAEALPISVGGPALAGAGRQWVDLDGQGASGILRRAGAGHQFHRNLGGGRFSAGAPVRLPAVAQAGAQLLDLDGDGRPEFVSFGSVSGFHHVGDGAADGMAWDALVPFQRTTSAAPGDGVTRLWDLTGDGLADLVVARRAGFDWHHALGRDGFDEFRRKLLSSDERIGPTHLFTDPLQSVFLADMTGDGLVDLVRVQGRSVCYWQNYGHGRFGPRVLMAAPSGLDDAVFDPSRVRFVDIDGTGPADLVYLGRAGIQVWRNESGNAWSTPTSVGSLPPATAVADIQVLDVFADGTACLVWTSGTSHDTGFEVRVLRLMSGTGEDGERVSRTPNLLSSVENGLGGRQTLTWGTSTQQWLLDREEGRDWVTRLPFASHVVTEVLTEDLVSETSSVARYRYHHGHYDGQERELRGFGRVDQWDAAEFDPAGESASGAPHEAGGWATPVLTRRWYHTGAFFGQQRVGEYLRSEYHPETVSLTDTGLDPTWSARERREACRALSGQLLREEVFAADAEGTSGVGVPYTVREVRPAIQMRQPSVGGASASFATYAAEELSAHYERSLTNPRIAHQMVLEVDERGFPTKQAALLYPPFGSSEAAQRGRISYTETTVGHFDDPNHSVHPAALRLGVTVDQHSLELYLPRDNWPASAEDDLLTPSDVLAATTAQALPSTAWDGPSTDVAARRLVAHQRPIYYDTPTDGSAPTDVLSPGSFTIPLLRAGSYSLAFTSDVVADAFAGDNVPPALADDPDPLTAIDAILGEGGYRQSDLSGAALADAFTPQEQSDYGLASGWWAYGGWATLGDSSTFYRPIEVFGPRTHPDLSAGVPPSGAGTKITYDSSGLGLPSQILGPEVPGAGGIAAPYRPSTTATYDLRVLQPHTVVDVNDSHTAIAFDPLGRVTAVALLGKDPVANPVDSLAAPTIAYDYVVPVLPGPSSAAHVHETRLMTHGAAPASESRVYSDGLGRELLTKAKADPGEALSWVAADADSPPMSVDTGTTPRWVASGRTIYDAKGRPVRQYEPWFSTTPDLEPESVVFAHGVTDLLTYDPLGRVIRVDHPDTTFVTTDFDPWAQEVADENSTAYATQWYADRAKVHEDTGITAADVRAAELTSAYFRTKRRITLDSLGEAWRELAGEGSTLARTWTVRDSSGVVRQIVDPLERVAFTYSTDLLGRVVHQTSIDGGPRWQLESVSGTLLRAWDALGRVVRPEHDGQERLTHVWVTEDGASEQLMERLVYGEAAAGDPKALGLVGVVHRHYHGAGLNTVDSTDADGNVTSMSLRLAADGTGIPVWPAAATDPSEPHATLLEHLDSVTASVLEPLASAYTQTATFDAQGRPLHSVLPDGVTTVDSTYGFRGNLATSSMAPGGGAAAPALTAVDYNARGQRASVQYANGAETTWTYDPLTFRLTNLRTTRWKSQLIQDVVYTYDAAGQLVEQDDRAKKDVLTSNQEMSHRRRFRYDLLGRLVEASGLEHASLSPTSSVTPDAVAIVSGKDDGLALRAYTQAYRYDLAGNIIELAHEWAKGTARGRWKRRYYYEGGPVEGALPVSNRLVSTEVNGNSLGSHTYDAHGNMLSMPHLPTMSWTWSGALKRVTKTAGVTEPGVGVHFQYDPGGERVRKRWVKTSGNIAERVYLGGFELYREYADDAATEPEFVRTTVHVADESGRFLMIETKTVDSASGPTAPRYRYQIGDHLQSASLELDSQAKIISEEEFHPYGTTAWWRSVGTTEVSAKRYRYTGMERDEETGLSYHSARYYAPWMGRWCSADPVGVQGGMNLFEYAHSTPVRKHDRSGTTPPGKTDWVGATGVRPHAEYFGPRESYRHPLASWLAEQGYVKLAELVHAGHGCAFCHTVKDFRDYRTAENAIDLAHYNRQGIALYFGAAAASIHFSNVLIRVEVVRTVSLERAVRQQYGKLKTDMKLGNKKTGPVLSGVHDPDTGEVFFGLNARLGEEYKNLHPLLKTRAADMGEGLTKAQPGTHSEVFAASEALYALEARTGRVATRLDLKRLKVFSLRLRASTKGRAIPPCANCDVITAGAGHPTVIDGTAVWSRPVNPTETRHMLNWIDEGIPPAP